MGERNELMKSLKKELRSLKRKFNDERRTRIVNVAVSEEVKPAATAKKSTEKKKTATKDPALTVSPTLTF